MPRKDDPRIVIRLSPADAAVIEAAAASVGVAVGGLVRECAVRYAAVVARDVSAGRVRLRRRSSTSSVPVPGRGGREASGPSFSSPADAPGTSGERVEEDRRGAEAHGAPALDPGVARAMAFRRALTPR